MSDPEIEINVCQVECAPENAPAWHASARELLHLLLEVVNTDQVIESKEVVEV